MIDHEFIQIATVEEYLYNPLPGYGSASNKYSFEYDTNKRLVAVNDRYFTFGKSGKVISSLINRLNTHSGRNYLYTEVLNYQWDARGRLSAITADSLYHLQNSGEITAPIKAFESKVWCDYSKAFYNDKSQLPSSADYLLNYDQAGQDLNTETIVWEYEGRNIKDNK